MNLCRAVHQGEIKAQTSRNVPQWVKELPWMSSLPAGTPPEAPPAASQYVFGFNRDLLLAWKVDMASNKKQKIMSLPLEEPPDCPPSGPMLARWPDGSTHDVSELSVQEYQEIKRSRGTGKKDPVKHWEGEHKTTHHLLSISPKPDKNGVRLMILREQRKHILQVNCVFFDNEEAAHDFMKEIAERYAANEIMKNDLKSERNKRLDKIKKDKAPSGPTQRRAAKNSVRPQKKVPSVSPQRPLQQKSPVRFQTFRRPKPARRNKP